MRFKLTLAIIASIAAAPAVAAEQTSKGRGVYFGIFGGGGSSKATDVDHLGTAYFTEAEGGPLAVNASGRTDSGDVGFFGGQVGYELSSYPSVVLPAFEIEGFHLDTGTRSATLHNPTDRLPEHTFDNTYPMNSAVLLANIVLSFPTSFYGLTPYIGGGIGAARVSIDGAESLQVEPVEVGVNHFNSGTDSEAWTFAAQVKAGIRLALTSNVYIFGEYRYLYVGATDQTFGPTNYPNHAQTSAWTQKFGETSHHLGTAGIGLNF